MATNYSKSETWTGAMSPWNFTTQAGGSDGYDAEDRFMNFVQPARNRNVSFTRSDIGNIADIDINGNVKSRSYSDVHALLSTTTIVGGRTYDDDGNLVGNTLQSYVWDAAGRLKRANVSLGSISEYGYDSQNKRRWRKVTRGTTYSPGDPPAGVETVYIYAGANCVAEYPRGAAADSPSQEYVYGLGIDSVLMLVRNGGAQKLTVTRNQQWSVTALADSATGDVLERYAYDEFGKRTILELDGSTVRPTSDYDMRYGYTSRCHDSDTGLMYFRARYYDTATGEFVSRDPLEYVDGMSLYRGYFVPSGVDPSGLFDCDPSWKESSCCLEYCGAAGGSGKECQWCCNEQTYCSVKSGPTYTPNETIKATVNSDGSKSAEFNMSAEFNDDPAKGILASCCEVRQYIKWDQEIPNHAGFKPVTDYKENTWYEDRAPFSHIDTQNRYGHRDGPGTDRNNQYFKGGVVDMKNGDVYKGKDVPRNGNGTYTGNWFFKLVVIDVCNGCEEVGNEATVTLDW